MAPDGQKSKTRISADDVAALEHLQAYLNFASAFYGSDEPEPTPRKRKASIPTFVKRLRRAGEHGPVSVKLPDGTIITSNNESTAPERTEIAPANEWDEVFNDG
jgi:hypothetical protein